VKNLSLRQKQVYDFIVEYCRERGFSPSLADIAAATGLHESTIAVYVETLKRKGVVKSEYRVARSLRPVEKPVLVCNEIKEMEPQTKTNWKRCKKHLPTWKRSIIKMQDGWNFFGLRKKRG